MARFEDYVNKETLDKLRSKPSLSLDDVTLSPEEIEAYSEPSIMDEYIKKTDPEQYSKIQQSNMIQGAIDSSSGLGGPMGVMGTVGKEALAAAKSGSKILSSEANLLSDVPALKAPKSSGFGTFGDVIPQKTKQNLQSMAVKSDAAKVASEVKAGRALTAEEIEGLNANPEFAEEFVRQMSLTEPNFTMVGGPKNVPGTDFLLKGEGKLTPYNPSGSTSVARPAESTIASKTSPKASRAAESLDDVAEEVSEEIGEKQLPQIIEEGAETGLAKKSPEVIGEGIKRVQPAEEAIDATFKPTGNLRFDRALKALGASSVGAGLLLGGKSLLSGENEQNFSAKNPDLLALNAEKWQKEFGNKPKDSLVATEEEPSDISSEVPKAAEKKSSIIDAIIPSASAKESMPDMPPSAKPRAEEPEQPKELTKPEEILEPEERGFTEATVENLRAAQEQAKKDRAFANLLESSALMGAGALGSRYKVASPDISGAKRMSEAAMEEADRPLKDLQARIDMEKSDPKSVRSVNARSMFKTMLKNANLDLKIPDNMSEEDLVKRYPIVEKLIKNKEDSELKQQEIKQRGIERIELQREKNELALKQLEQQALDRSLDRESRERIQQQIIEARKDQALLNIELRKTIIDAQVTKNEKTNAMKLISQAPSKISKAGGVRGTQLRGSMDQANRIFGTLGIDTKLSEKDIDKINVNKLDDKGKLQLIESAIELNKLLSGQGIPAQATLQKLVPSNIKMKATDWLDYATSQQNPRGQGAFLKDILKITARIRDYAKAENTKLVQGEVAGLALLKEHYPDEYQNILQTHNLMDVDEYLDYQKSKQYEEFEKPRKQREAALQFVEQNKNSSDPKTIEKVNKIKQIIENQDKEERRRYAE